MGVIGLAASPQTFVRWGSTSLGLNDALLAMRLVWAKLFAAGAAAGEALAGTAMATRPPAATNTAAADRHRRPPPGVSVPGNPALLGACRIDGSLRRRVT